jgi:endonuclease/exonuclease/phosphatase family metal-dependent hydrolase
VAQLRSGTMYCFRVARPDGSRQSRAFCHTTPRQGDTTGTASFSVVPYNVCAAKCSRWKQRRDAVVPRIVAADADVVALQERRGSSPFLTSRLRRHGYSAVVTSGDEQLFARDARLTHRVGGRPGPAGVVRRAGTVAPWATLRDRATGRAYTVVSVHLAAGRSRQADAKRFGRPGRC